MATYRLEAKVISRAKGRSATASAAYRSGAAIEDERTGQIFDYTRMRGVRHSEIMAPENTPDWMLDRSTLWNAVERIEQRRDAQLARDFVFSLPHELTNDQRVELVREFIGQEFVARGMIADFSIHAPDRRGDPRNHHAHVMVTMRELTGNGFGLKNREWNRTELLEEWRERWADTVNRHLEGHGHEARVDHRSLEDQGVNREPEPKQGPVATEMELNGRASHAGDDRRAAKARNEERDQWARAANDVEAELIMLDPDRPRGPAFEDIREALEGKAGKRRIRPRFAEPDGGMVAQQSEALRRFRSNTARLDMRRWKQSRKGAARPLSLDGSGEISKLAAGNEELSPMVSKYDHLRNEQSKATPDQAQGQPPGLAQGQKPPQPEPEIAEQARSQADGLKWMDQSMVAQNAAARDQVKASHEQRQDQIKAREAPEHQEDRNWEAEPEQSSEQPEQQLRFAGERSGERGDDRSGRIDLNREPTENEQSQDGSGERQLRFSEERGGDRSGRIDLKREQSEVEIARDESGDKQLNFGRDRNQAPDLDH